MGNKWMKMIWQIWSLRQLHWIIWHSLCVSVYACKFKYTDWPCALCSLDFFLSLSSSLWFLLPSFVPQASSPIAHIKLISTLCDNMRRIREHIRFDFHIIKERATTISFICFQSRIAFFARSMFSVLLAAECPKTNFVCLLRIRAHGKNAAWLE